jgi:hypothetical protein
MPWRMALVAVGAAVMDAIVGWLDVLGVDHVRVIDFGQVVKH